MQNFSPSLVMDSRHQRSNFGCADISYFFGNPIFDFVSTWIENEEILKTKKNKEFSFSNKFFNLGLNDSYKGFVKIFFEKFTDNWVRNAPFQFYSNLKYQVFK